MLSSLRPAAAESGVPRVAEMMHFILGQRGVGALHPYASTRALCRPDRPHLPPYLPIFLPTCPPSYLPLTHLSIICRRPDAADHHSTP